MCHINAHCESMFIVGLSSHCFLKIQVVYNLQIIEKESFPSPSRWKNVTIPSSDLHLFYRLHIIVCIAHTYMCHLIIITFYLFYQTVWPSKASRKYLFSKWQWANWPKGFQITSRYKFLEKCPVDKHTPTWKPVLHIWILCITGIIIRQPCRDLLALRRMLGSLRRGADRPQTGPSKENFLEYFFTPNCY